MLLKAFIVLLCWIGSYRGIAIIVYLFNFEIKPFLVQSIFSKAAHKIQRQNYITNYSSSTHNFYGPLKCICHTLFVIVTIRDKEIHLDKTLGSNNKGILFPFLERVFPKVLRGLWVWDYFLINLTIRNINILIWSYLIVVSLQNL